jgi:hypothetical protein
MSIFNLNNLLKFITLPSKSESKQFTETSFINISDSNSLWNIAAVTLSNRSKVATKQEQNIICYPSIEGRKINQDFHHRTTDEWNKLALNVADQKLPNKRFNRDK